MGKQERIDRESNEMERQKEGRKRMKEKENNRKRNGRVEKQESQQ